MVNSWRDSWADCFTVTAKARTTEHFIPHKLIGLEPRQAVKQSVQWTWITPRFLLFFVESILDIGSRSKAYSFCRQCFHTRCGPEETQCINQTITTSLPKTIYSPSLRRGTGLCVTVPFGVVT